MSNISAAIKSSYMQGKVYLFMSFDDHSTKISIVLSLNKVF